MAVKVHPESGFATDVAEALFPVGRTDYPDESKYAAAADGKRFLVLERVDGARSPPFRVVVNWRAKLKPNNR